MKAYLRTVPVQNRDTTIDVTYATRDLTLDVPDSSVLELGAIITGTIATGNSGRQDAYVAASYPTLELLGVGNLQLGAAVLTPAAGVPGMFPVGTQVTFQVTGQ